MKKRLISFVLTLTMLASMSNFGTFFATTASAAGGSITLIATEDAYVQGASGSSVAKGKEDQNNLNGRDWSDAATAPSAYMLPYIQFELPSIDEFNSIDDIKGVKLKVFCMSGKNDKYIVGLSDMESFDEDTLTYNKALEADKAAVVSKRLSFDQEGRRIEGSEVAFTSVTNEWLEFDVTSKLKELIANNTSGERKTVVLTVAPRSRVAYPELAYHGSVVFCSKEYQNGAYAPRLEIEADSRISKSQSSISDFYSNSDDGEVEDEKLVVSTSDSTFVEFSPIAGFEKDDVVENAYVRLNFAPGSTEPTDIFAYALNGFDDESGELLTVTVKDDSVEIDVAQQLALYCEQEKNLIIKIGSGNGVSVPVIFSSSRGDEGCEPKLFYDLVYKGNVSYIEVEGPTEAEISLLEATEYQYSAIAFDRYNEETDFGGMRIVYSLDSAPFGVTITQNGLLKVNSDAHPGTAVIRAESESMPGINATFEVELTQVPPASCEIKGAIDAKIPKVGNVLTKPYFVEFYTDGGLKLPFVKNITWSVVGPDGISIEAVDESNANLIIDNTEGNLNIGDEIEIKVTANEFTNVSTTLKVTLGETDQVYTQIVIPVSHDTYIKKSDFATKGNNNSGELLAKQRATTALLPGVTDYFTQEGTNRETYIKFDGLSVLPEDIISAYIELTTNKNYNSTSSAPAEKMPKAVIYQLSDTNWSETEGTIKSRISVTGKEVASENYAITKDSKTKFDVTSVMRDILAGDADSAAFRVSMAAIRNNGYTQSYYSKDATVKNEQSGINEPIEENKKPRLIISASYIRQPSSITLEGNEKAGIMLEETKHSYSLHLVDQFGQLYSDLEMKEFTPSLSLKENYDGISFEDNVLTIYPYAMAQDITICAKVDEFPEFDREFTVNLYRAEAATIELEGPDSIQTPSYDEAVYAEYRIKVYDQYENVVNIPDSVYELAEPQTGVTIDEDGTLSVTNFAIAGREIRVHGYSKSNSSISVIKAVRILPKQELSGNEKHPNLLYSNEDLVPLRTKINTEPFASYYSTLKQKADAYTAEDMVYLAKLDPREPEDDPYDHAYPLVEVDENGKEKVLDRKRPWQWMTTDLFYTQGNFTFTPPTGAKYAKLQAVAKGQGITHFDKFTFKIESGNSIDLFNADMETGNLRYVNEDLPYNDGDRYQVVETSQSGWEYLNDVQSPMPEGFYYIRTAGSDSTFEWANQNYQKDKIASSGIRSAKIVNNNISSYAGISTDKVSVSAGTTYVLSTGFGGNDKLIGEKGRLKEYQPLDKTAGLSMQVVYYDADGNEMGIKNWEQMSISNRPMNINWQVKPLRRQFDDFFDACCTIYAVTKNLDYAIRAKEILKYQLEDMKWGMKYRTTNGYNPKMNDAYEAVHTGRTLQRDALGFDMIYDSGVIRDEEDKYIRSLFNWVAYELTSTAYYNYAAANGQIHNYNADRISALILYALCFLDNQGTEANKYKDTFEFFYNHVMDKNNVWSLPTMMKNGVYDAGDEYGGMWCENMRYHRSVLGGWMLAAKAVDRYDPESNLLQSEALKKMSRMWVTAQGPKLVVSTNAKNLAGYPTVGDQSWRESIDMAAWCAGLYKDTDPELSGELMYTWDRLGSQLGGSYPINVLLDNDPTLARKNPELSSMYLPNVGYTYFWQNFDVLGKENLVLIPNSPGYGNKNQPIHDHHDRGSFAYFANGTPMSLDSGMGAYFGSDSAFWRSSRSHNVILFWSDTQGEWLSNAGGDGNTYTSDTGKTRYYDSETTDFSTSDEIDTVTIKVNPAVRDGKDTNLEWNRHFAYIKDGINALIYWDEVKNTRKSQFNLYMASKNYTQNGDMVLANMHNNMQMEVHMLGSNNPKITNQWVPSAGAYGIPTVDGSEQQQRIMYEQSGGQDYLTVLYAKGNGEKGLTSEKIETGNDSIVAYQMQDAKTGNSFYVVVNETSTEQKTTISQSKQIRNVRTGEVFDKNAQITIGKEQMVIFADNSIEKAIPAQMMLTGETVVGVPYGDTALTYSYVARVFDQYGSTIDGIKPHFELVGENEYVTVDDDGTVTLLPGFEQGSVIELKATYMGVSDTVTITADSEDKKITSVDIVGSTTLVTGNDTSEYTYNAVFKNASGAPVAGAKALWTLLNATEGVKLNSYTGTLSIDKDVPVGTIIHISVSHYNDPSVNKTIEVLIVEEKETGIYADISNEIGISHGVEISVQLTGYTTNQQGGKYGEVIYSLKQAYDGVSVSENGLLTISDKAKIGDRITIVVQSKQNLKIKKEFTVKFVPNEIKSIVIEGADSITAAKTNVYKTYSAKVVDKNGNTLDKTVTWSISGHENVSVDNGTVCVKPGAKSGTATLTAVLDGDSSIFTQFKINIYPYTETVGGFGGGAGGGGSSGAGTSGSINPGSSDVPLALKFTDVPVTHWAYEYIYKLVNIKAVNGKTETTFEPETNITRAEFVKILINALGLEGTGKDVTFADVNKGDWYYQSVSVATELGIVNGVSETRFGANELITREQMAAIIYRTMTTMGAKFDVSGEKFADNEKISGYAKDAVMALKNEKILSGKGGNNFAPKDNTKRAEAAKVISMVRDLAR